MTVQELIDGLNKLENKQATVHLVVGAADHDESEHDTTDVELWSDHTTDGYQDIFGAIELATR